MKRAKGGMPNGKSDHRRWLQATAKQLSRKFIVKKG